MSLKIHCPHCGNEIHCPHCGNETLVFNAPPDIGRAYLGEPVIGFGVKCTECNASFSLSCIEPENCDAPK